MCDRQVRAEMRALRLPSHRSRHRGRRQILLLCELCARSGHAGSTRSSLNQVSILHAENAEDLLMKVRDVMTADPACCVPTDTIQQAAKLMVEADCGCIPVVEDL